MKYFVIFSSLLLAACSGNPKLVNYRLPVLPASCKEDPAKLSKKDIHRDLHIVEAAEWHIDDRIMYSKERAMWLDCQRFLRRTWKNMQSKK